MYGQNVNIRFGGPITPTVKKLMLANVIIFLLQNIIGLISPNTVEVLFGLSYTGFIQEFKLWQIFTYMFLHGGWLHIIFNLLALWMFAGEIEQLWGSRRFIKFYCYSGIGAGVFISMMNLIIYNKYHIAPVTIGASGVLYALLLAYGMTWPNREVLLYFILPVKIKYLVIGFGIIEFFGTLSSASGTGGNVSHIGHLGGLISGFIFIFFQRKSEKGSARIKKKESFLGKKIKSARLKKKKMEIDNRIKAKKIIDSLLEKIARNGMISLTAEEKKDLEWARKHYYPEGDDTLH